MIKKPKGETWFEFMDRAKKNGLSPTTQEEIDDQSKIDLLKEFGSLAKDLKKVPFTPAYWEELEAELYRLNKESEKRIKETTMTEQQRHKIYS